MRFKGNNPLNETIRPEPEQTEVRYPRLVRPEDYSTMEVIANRENDQSDEGNLPELEQTNKDFWGRSAAEGDGAIPAEPPDDDPLSLQPPRKPKGPPKNNM